MKQDGLHSTLFIACWEKYDPSPHMALCIIDSRSLFRKLHGFTPVDLELAGTCHYPSRN